MQALIRHLHDFLREVRLTEEEWAAGIEFLTAAGHITDDTRQEFILLSDVLGASMQTIAINNDAHGDATEATVFGPFFVEDAPASTSAATSASAPPASPAGSRAPSPTSTAIRCPARGSRSGRPTTTASTTCSTTTKGPVAAHTCSPTTTAGMRSGDSPPRRTRSRTTARSAGCWRRPGAHRCAPRICTSWSPHPDMRTLVTHIFVRGDELLDSRHRVRRQGLAGQGLRRAAAGTPAPNGRDLSGSGWSKVQFDIVLAPRSA